MSGKVHGEPTKDFFVDMITRDISLQGCIFDLLDNSIDGARRDHRGLDLQPLHGSQATIAISADDFCIADNCGGIRLSDAIDYAFHFGRRQNSPADVPGGIGLYGIGMKRAIFKLGRVAEIRSETKDDSFRVLVDVDRWKAEAAWDFDYEDMPRTGTFGTTIKISRLNPGVAATMADPSFRNSLIRDIAQDYAFYIASGFRVSVNGADVPSYKYELKNTELVAPAVDVYEDDGVRIRLAAGLIDDLPEDVPADLSPGDVDRYGWFVICNKRVVLAGDKSDRTVWGNDGYKIWHPQYNGFAGFAFFDAEDQRKLPWTTTKRDLDDSVPLYRRALLRMKTMTDPFVDYTNRRKSDLSRAKDMERADTRIDVATLTAPRAAQLPAFELGAKKRREVTISYPKPVDAVESIREHLGRPAMSAREIGAFTFDYYRKTEIGE